MMKNDDNCSELYTQCSNITYAFRLDHMVYTVHCTLYSVQCTVYSVHHMHPKSAICEIIWLCCTMYNVHCTLYSDKYLLTER